MKSLGYISKEEIKRLVDGNHSVAFYPRKKEIVVNGYKRYTVKTSDVKEIAAIIKK
jgi:hypothetical protein